MAPPPSQTPPAPQPQNGEAKRLIEAGGLRGAGRRLTRPHLTVKVLQKRALGQSGPRISQPGAELGAWKNGDLSGHNKASCLGNAISSGPCGLLPSSEGPTTSQCLRWVFNEPDTHNRLHGFRSVLESHPPPGLVNTTCACTDTADLEPMERLPLGCARQARHAM